MNQNHKKDKENVISKCISVMKNKIKLHKAKQLGTNLLVSLVSHWKEQGHPNLPKN